MRRLPTLLAALAALAGCKPLSDADAVALVRNYNARVIEAFRTGDARLVDPVTGATDGKRLTGLIGVKSDMGLTLDSTLTEFKPLRVTHGEGEVVVYTEERWSYRDRRIGSGEQVGEASDDHYFMRYHLKLVDRRWVVEEIAFDRAPVVGRKEAPVAVDARLLHGAMETVDPGTGAAPGPAAAGAALPPGHPPAPPAGKGEGK